MINNKTNYEVKAMINLKQYSKIKTILRVIPIFMFFILSSCVTLKPEMPKVPEKINPAEPVNPSTINIPIKINIKQFESILNKSVPNDLFSESDIDAGHGVTMQLDVKRDGAITLETINGKVNTTIPIYIKGRVNWKSEANVNQKLGSYNLAFNVYKLSHHEDFDAKIILKTSTLINIDKNWNLLAITDSDFQLNKAPSVEVLGFKITFAKIASDNIKSQLPLINKAINDQIKSALDLRKEASNYWNMIKAPVLFSEQPVKIWGIFEPESFNFASPVSLDNKTLLLNISLISKVKTYVGDNPPNPVNGQLIPLKNEKANKNDFNINLPVYVEMKALEEIAKQNILNQEFDLPGTDRKVKIKTLSLYGMGDIVVCKVYIESKKTKGDVYLVSKLVYNPETKEIYAQDLDFDVNTSNLLYNKASWLVNKLFLSKIEKNLRYNTTEILEKSRLETEKAINNTKVNEMISITGKIDQLQVENISTETNFLKINTHITGSIGVELK